MPENNNRYLVNASWLIRLRWVAAFGQLLTISTAALAFGLSLPIGPLLTVVGVTAVSNLFLNLWYRQKAAAGSPKLNSRKWDLVLGSIMTMDMISLTVLLLVTGGFNNPFSLFFFVNLSLSAVVLSRYWAWALNLLSILCFGVLLFYFWPLDYPGFGIAIDPIFRAGTANAQHLGLFVAFATCSSVITYFMTRLTDSLRQQELDLRQAQSAQAKSEKLEALGTLAAGAAHELASPLSTIAIVAKDLEGLVFDPREKLDTSNEDLVTDVKLIRDQVNRCRKILDRMAGHAGQTVGETIQTLTMGEIWQRVVEELEEPQRVETVIDRAAEDVQLKIPVEAVGQSLRGLVQNAIDAEPEGSKIVAHIRLEDADQQHSVTIKIKDHGPGMSGAVLARISEPFFTTKPTGKGMGLGVFLAKNVIERIGGVLQFESSEGQGTTAIIRL